MTNNKETAAQKRMREFREAQAELAANRQRAKGGERDRVVHEASSLGDPGERPHW